MGLGPTVSVVVATHNRPERLAILLTALRDQDLPADEFELVVVDDGSPPGTDAVLDAELARGELVLRVVRNEDPSGPAAARNAGWPLTHAPLIAFTDDDCVPVRGWLSSALAARAQAPTAIIQGPTEPHPDERGHISLFTHTVVQRQLGPNYETCNIFYPREILEALGGFDETFGPGSAGEDTDLAWRALAEGHAAVFAPDAQVFHAVERVGLRRKLRQATRWTQCVRILAEHPESRSMLQRRFFWNTWHYLLCRAVLSLLLPRWLRRVVLARYILQLEARSRQVGAGTTSLPFFILHDVIETWAIARGAIRYRTLVL